MIKTLEKAGRTEEDAIQAALKELGMDRDDVSVEILERAKTGFFGIGASPAKVRVTYECEEESVKAEPVVSPAPAKAVSTVPKAEPKQSDPKQNEPKQSVKAKKDPEPQNVVEDTSLKKSAGLESDEKTRDEEIRSFLTGLFDRMGVKADISITSHENGAVDVNLTGNGMGAIIGRRGETLDAIQHLTNYVVNHGGEKRRHINVDAEDYRSKREESLTRLAEKMAEKAIRYKRNMALEPMNSYERHVIHTALQNYKGVTTASTGEEPNRRVVVTYVKTKEDEASSQSNKPKVREWA